MKTPLFILPENLRIVVEVLEKGRKNAKTSGAIRATLQMSSGIRLNDVQVRAAVKDLIEEHGYAIGSTPNAPAGFYLIETKEETEENVAHLMSRATSIMKRVSALKRIPAAEAVKQLGLAFKESPWDEHRRKYGPQGPKGPQGGLF